VIVRSVRARSLHANRRLDCKYFCSPGTQAAERLTLASAAGADLRTIGGPKGLGKVWAPSRFKRAYASPGEDGVAYLRPYDVFDYVPQAADILSVKRSDNLAELMAPPGALLQTCSGRNLGPAVAVDAHLATFALSHDLIRVEIDDEVTRCYLLAFLSTPTGQALIRRDKTGSVIDHISVGHLADAAVPFFDEAVRANAAGYMRRAVGLREQARIALAAVVDSLTATLAPIERAAPAKAGWTVQARTVGSRVDAAFHDPLVAKVRAELLAAGGQQLAEVADVAKPSGRYKTYYVDANHGRPLLSGRQVLQYFPVNLQHISPRSLEPARYELRRSTIAFQADGRSEERLGAPVMIEPGRDRWLASGHVGRLSARKGIDPGWLWGAFATDHVQLQIKALACGSVVDALYPKDLEQVVLPAPGSVDVNAVSAAWKKFTDASHAQSEAIAVIEGELTRLTGETPLSA